MAYYDDTDLDFILPPLKREIVGPVIAGKRRAANSEAWALGSQQKNGFRIRRIVWGKLLAREEKREGEEIRRATICVAPKHSR